MIDFKYYVVAITAVLVALVIGLLLGASLSTGEIVKQQQEAFIKSVRNDLSKLRSEIETKNKEIEELSNYQKKAQKWLVEDALSGMTVGIVYVNDPENAPDLNEIKKTLEMAGANVFEVILPEDTTETTLISATVKQLFAPGVSLEGLPSRITVKGKLTQAQEVLIIVDSKLLEIARTDKNLSDLPELRYAVFNLESAVVSLDNAPSGSTAVIFNGDPYDPEALVLSFKAEKGIYGEMSGGAEILPEKK